jgi:uncharacterized membrane protein YgcG
MLSTTPMLRTTPPSSTRNPALFCESFWTLFWVTSWVVFCTISLGSTCYSEERIESFQSDIQLQRDGELLVTETITVHAEGDSIKRGIFRDFPTLYKQHFGINVQVPFEVVSVRRDQQTEPYHIDHRSNGVRVYIGAENVLLRPGLYTYEIQYKTDYQVGYFAEHDELYWNATGNGWSFPIERASCTVSLPLADQAPSDLAGKLSAELFTGPAGAKDQNGTSQIDSDQPIARFTTTQALAAQEGLTIVVTFPKGIIEPLTASDSWHLYWPAIRALIFAVLGLTMVIAYYFYAWVRVGRDPPGGVIIPLFEPPANLGPGCVRYLRRLGYDRKCFAASLLNLAVQHHIKITEREGVFSIKYLTRAKDTLPSTDIALLHAFAGRKDAIQLVQTNHRIIRQAIDSVRHKLKQEYEDKLFYRNRKWLIPGWILSLLAMILACVSVGGQGMMAGFGMLVWGSIWTVGCLVLGFAAYSQWRLSLSMRNGVFSRVQNIFKSLVLTAFCVPFFIGEFVALFAFINLTGYTVPIEMLLLGTIGYLFWHWIKQPTVEGQRLRDAIEGFRMYLGTAEQDYLQAMHPPEKTPELFERFLPYAVALDVENEWGEQFSDVLAKAAAGPETSDGTLRAGYNPSWYSGNHFENAAAGAFASSLAASMGAAIASSATAPGSSSGSSGGGGGGGSSGGGGGGGGGGGW